mgnify:CR=1 FL=1
MFEVGLAHGLAPPAERDGGKVRLRPQEGRQALPCAGEPVPYDGKRVVREHDRLLLHCVKQGKGFLACPGKRGCGIFREGKGRLRLLGDERLTRFSVKTLALQMALQAHPLCPVFSLMPGK